MKGWERKKLKEICSYLNRGISPIYAEEGILIVNQKCIRDNRISFDEAKKSSYAKKISSDKIIKIGDILVNSTGFGTLGRTAQVKNLLETSSIDTHVTIVRIIESVNPIFIGYQLAFREPILSGLGKGATQQTELSRDDLGNVDIFLPSRQIQDKIASILSAYDDLIENNLKRIKLLEETARITYEEWFVNFNVNGQKLKLRNGLPVGWEIKKLNEVAEINKRQIKKGYQEKIKYVDISSVSPGKIDFYTEYSIEDAPGRARRTVKHGDVIWSCVRPNRKSHCIIWNPDPELIVSTGFVVITPIELPTSYLYQCLTTEAFVGRLTSLASGATYPAVTPYDFENADIIVPPIEIVREFDRHIKPTIDLIADLTIQNNFLKEARDILLPKLMLGAIEVKAEQKPKAKVVSIESKKPREANWEFKEAVLISLLTHRFGSKQYPLGRKRYTKFSYLFHRHVDNKIQDYGRKAAGPYNPKTKYKGPEKIAHENGYVEDYQSGKISGFVSGKNIAAAQTYFEKYWNLDDLNWLDINFKYKSNDELELYATVDNALLELYQKNKAVNVTEVKAIIRTEKEWKAKLERDIFSDVNIQKALDYLPTLFQYP